MRREAVKYLRSHLRSLMRKKPKTDLGFNMAFYALEGCSAAADRSGHGCGTVGCLAGWTVATMTQKGAPRVRPLSGAKLYDLDRRTDSIRYEATVALGLTHTQACQLFLPSRRDDITVKEAIAVLSGLLKTGEVNWGSFA